MTRPAGTPEARGSRPTRSGEIDITVPSVARIYDYVLGGKENFESDRAAARGLLRSLPEAAQPARENRAFLRRAVRYLVADAGIRQILDIGSGLPTEGNVHEVAQAIDPSVHVVYVDVDPIVLAHGRALLARSPHTTVVTADVREPDSIFADPHVLDLIDPTRPFAILLGGVLHHLPDADDPVGVVDDLVARLPVGGHLLISNFLGGDHPRSRELEQAFRQNRISAARFRTWPEQRRFFAGLEMVEPGLVYVNDWRPDADTPTDSAVHTLHVAGVGRKAG
jgi:hypothetical protein